MSVIPTPHEEHHSFVVPTRQLTWRAPLRWLGLGWQDFKRTPALSLLFGAVIVLVSLTVSVMAWYLGRFALLATLLSGFVFIAPLIGVGLYCVSRGLENGRTPRLCDSFALAKRVMGQAGIFALLQMVILLLWSRAGLLINVFAPDHANDFSAVCQYIAIGAVAGSVFAALTFATSVFSLPMIADRDVDMITACVSSVNAVLQNKGVMLFWAFLIALLTAIGFATAFLGLAIIMPWLAYSAWHGYRETLDASVWPSME